MKHKHHKIPKYMGGSDDKSNLIELTVFEHAEEHRKLYELYGNIQDYCAWKGLLGILSKEEIINVLCSEGGKKGGKKGGTESAKLHKQNKTGLFREDHYIQKIGNKIGASLGGKKGSLMQIKNKIGIFSYSNEEKSKICAKGGSVSGKISGKNHKINKTGIFDEKNRKNFCSLGGLAAKGTKKHYHSNGDFKMAKPGTVKSQNLLDNGYYLK